MFQKNNVLMKLKKQFKIHAKRVEGVVKKSEKGFGFLEIDSKISYFIPPKKIKKVIHGDKIIAKIGFSKNREIVIPEKLLESFLTIFVGRLQILNKKFFIIPDYPLIHECIPCTFLKDNLLNFESGDWFLAKLTQHKLKDNNFFHAELIKFISKKRDPFARWWVTLSKYNLKKEEPKVNLDNLSISCSDHRQDLTNLSFITIDNKNTKDIDDALFVKKKRDNSFQLIVAISDTTSFIDTNSELDNIASERGFTNYLPGFNVPMLPRILSENLCSLQPNEKRPVLACKIYISQDGRIKNKNKFFIAWIKSKAKLSYSNVSDWLEKKKSWISDDIAVQEQLLLLHKLCLSRMKWRKENALIFPERKEYKFHLSKKCEVLKISIDHRRIAHKIVEECMISANFVAGKFLSQKEGFGLYNNHSGFDISSAKNISLLLKKNNIFITPKELLTLKGFCKLYRILKKKKYKYLNSQIKKFQSFSEISFLPNPHFALGLKKYATWTSPIRKYGDIINHRFLKSIILNKNPVLLKNSILQKISDQKRKHRLSERDIEDFLYIQYFQKNNSYKEIFDAEIIDICRGGIRAKILKNGANIFVPKSFIYCNRSVIDLNIDKGIIYIKGKVFYKITDILKVQLTEVRMDKKSIIAKIII
ncbi:exoribonuclease II [Buchnera aphidicola]|uniref:exoribonuclease II n=1 Tax=Buchnera aphidicola TaxID=9 RepID=UPI002091EC27|nr:exoribonuclease II [Buchnera aphidicola]USS94306.1 exoribonuclease II [Buchnera aphidicola (Sipha maydis)]